MSHVAATTGATAAATAAAALANAIKASGAIVRVEPDAFLEVVARCEAPLVVVCETKSFFTTSNQYLTSYRGFIFCAKSPTPLMIPDWCEVIRSKSIWVPA
jgi:hypothetical protein